VGQEAYGGIFQGENLVVTISAKDSNTNQKADAYTGGKMTG